MGTKYQQRVVIGKDANGKEISKWASGNTTKEFQDSLIRLYLENGLLAQQQQQQQQLQKQECEVAFAEYAQTWFDTFKAPSLPPKTKTTRTSFFQNHIVNAFPGKAINRISVMDVQAVLNEMRKYSQSYLRDIMNYMKNIFDCAVSEGIIERNPMGSRQVFNPSKKKTVRKFLSPTEKADVIAHIPSLKNQFDRMELALLMFTPLRPGEMFALRWEDIDLDNKLIHVRRGSSFDHGKIHISHGKTTAAIRDVPLDDRLLEFLLPLEEQGFILHRTTAEEPYSEQTAKCAWERICKTIDVHGITPYCARHTYLTEANLSGIDLKTIQTIAGHADERMLMRTYVHSDSESAKRAGEKMTRYFANL